MSRIVQYSRYGGPEVLDIVLVDEPHAGPGQVRVAVRAAGLNNFDSKVRQTPATLPNRVLPSGQGAEFAGVVESFVLDGQAARLTQAALETLSVVAYKQPVSRARVSAIRGVNVDGVMRTLLTRGLVEEAGQDAGTGAHLYRTTTYFLERIGISSLDELPELAPYLPEMADLEDELERVGGFTAAPDDHVAATTEETP